MATMNEPRSPEPAHRPARSVSVKFVLSFGREEVTRRIGAWTLLAPAVLAVLVSANSSQDPAEGSRPPTAKTFPLSSDLGESLSFQVKLSKSFLSGTIGRLTISIRRSSEAPLLDHYMLRAEAMSDGLLPQLLGMEVHDVFDTFVSPEDFGVARSRRQIDEGRRKVFELTVFMPAEGKILLIRRDLRTPGAPPRVAEHPAPAWAQDALSAIYYIRSQPLTPGTALTVPVVNRERVYPIKVAVGEVEEIESSWGKLSALRLEPQVFGKGQMIDIEAQLTIWVTNDDRHLPLSAHIRGSFGQVTFLLKEIKGTSLPVPRLPNHEPQKPAFETVVLLPQATVRARVASRGGANY